MDCTSSTSRLMVLVGVVLLSCSPGSLAVSRRLLEANPAQDFAVEHAHIRACHFQRPLKYTQELADRAEQWASQYKANCAAASPAPGVNVFVGSPGGTWLPSDAVAAWAAEKDYYNYDSNSCAAGKECGHYKQVVWQGTKEVGCAVVNCDNGATLMTCHYEPQGDVEGQKPF